MRVDLARLTALLKRSLLALTVTLAMTAPAQPVTYSVDDGESDNALGLIEGGDLTFGNHFTAVPGGETIGSVGIVWGGVPDGKAMTSKLWSDPNGDGDPADAVLLSSVAGVTSDAGTDTFATYDIPDVTLTLGQSFFVGGTITHLEGEFPLAFDEDPPISDESWADETADFGPGSSPFNLGPIFGDLMVRATGIPAAPVPEPHLLTLLGVALAALALTTSRRRRTSPRGPR